MESAEEKRASPSRKPPYLVALEEAKRKGRQGQASPTRSDSQQADASPYELALAVEKGVHEEGETSPRELAFTAEKSEGRESASPYEFALAAERMDSRQSVPYELALAPERKDSRQASPYELALAAERKDSQQASPYELALAAEKRDRQGSSSSIRCLPYARGRQQPIPCTGGAGGEPEQVSALSSALRRNGTDTPSNSTRRYLDGFTEADSERELNETAPDRFQEAFAHGLPPAALELIRNEIADAVSNEANARLREVEELRQVVQLILGQYLLEIQLEVKSLRKRLVEEFGAERESRCARDAELHDRLGREISCVNSRLALETSRLEDELAEVRNGIDQERAELTTKVHEESHFRIRRIGQEFNAATTRLEEELFSARRSFEQEQEAFRNKLHEESNLRLREAELMRASLDSMWSKLQGPDGPMSSTSTDAFSERKSMKDRPPMQTSLPEASPRCPSKGLNIPQVEAKTASQDVHTDWSSLAKELATERRERKADVNATIGLVDGLKSQVKKLEETITASMRQRVM